MWRLLDNSYNTGNLQNRNGSWKYQDRIWTIPSEGTNDIIKDQVWGLGHGKVLGLMNDTLLPNNADGTEVILVVKDEQNCNGQQWFRGKSDENGWFTLRNPTSGLFLTGKPGDANPTIEGKYKEKKRIFL